MPNISGPITGGAVRFWGVDHPVVVFHEGLTPKVPELGRWSTSERSAGTRHFQPCQKRVAGQTSFSGGIWESLMVCIGATSRLRAVFIGGMAAETSTNVSRFQRDSWRVERGPDLYLKQTMTMAMTFLTWRADILLLISCTRERMEQHRWFFFG